MRSAIAEDNTTDSPTAASSAASNLGSMSPVSHTPISAIPPNSAFPESLSSEAIDQTCSEFGPVELTELSHDANNIFTAILRTAANAVARRIMTSLLDPACLIRMCSSIFLYGLRRVCRRSCCHALQTLHRRSHDQVHAACRNPQCAQLPDAHVGHGLLELPPSSRPAFSTPRSPPFCALAQSLSTRASAANRSYSCGGATPSSSRRVLRERRQRRLAAA